MVKTEKIIKSLEKSTKYWTNNLIFGTDKIDRLRVEKGIKGIYSFCDLPNPEIVYTLSPWVAYCTAMSYEFQKRIFAIPEELKKEIYSKYIRNNFPDPAKILEYKKYPWSSSKWI